MWFNMDWHISQLLPWTVQSPVMSSCVLNVRAHNGCRASPRWVLHMGGGQWGPPWWSHRLEHCDACVWLCGFLVCLITFPTTLFYLFCNKSQIYKPFYLRSKSLFWYRHFQYWKQKVLQGPSNVIAKKLANKFRETILKTFVKAKHSGKWRLLNFTKW